MIDHGHALTLAATALDFPLPPAEAAALTGHLASCPACTLAVQQLREDAAGLAGLERQLAPLHVREAVVRAAVAGRGAGRRGAGLRWSFAAVLLAVLAVGGTFVAGAMLERARDVGPTPTGQPAPQPTDAIVPSRPVGWTDLGLIGGAFDGRTVQLVLPAPGGGLVAIGRDQGSARPVVWTSDGGSTWTVTTQPEDVFGGRVPTGGALQDATLWVVGWDISVQGAQRAVWSSVDGVTWARPAGGGGLLGTEASDLDMTAGPAGLLVWAADGRAWTSSDGVDWDRSDAGLDSATDAAVDGAFRLVGLDGSRPTLMTSTDGRAWSAARQAATTDRPVGIEAANRGAVLAWVAGQAYRVTAQGWRKDAGAQPVPSGTIAGGAPGFAAVASPAADGAQRAWIGDGDRVWVEVTSDPVDRGGRTLVAVARFGDGWYVLTRQGGAYRGWSLAG